MQVRENALYLIDMRSDPVRPLDLHAMEVDQVEPGGGGHREMMPHAKGWLTALAAPPPRVL